MKMAHAIAVPVKVSAAAEISVTTMASPAWATNPAKAAATADSVAANPPAPATHIVAALVIPSTPDLMTCIDAGVSARQVFLTAASLCVSSASNCSD
jgi:hypothetical protein